MIATVRISVIAAPVNRLPMMTDDVVVAGGGPILFDPRANDRDPDGDLLTITAVGTPAHGAVTILSGGAGLRYDPVQGYIGGDSFSYTVTDGRGGVTTATVIIHGPRELNFYQPTVRAHEGVQGTLAGSTFDIPYVYQNGVSVNGERGVAMSYPPTASFTAEIDVVEMGVNSGWFGVANDTWWAQGPSSSNTSAGAISMLAGSGWYSAGGELVDPLRVPQPGDVLGMVYSDVSRTLRIYLNGALVARLHSPEGGDAARRFPMLLAYGGRMAGSFRSVLSEHAQAYVMDDAARERVAAADTPLVFDPRVAANDRYGPLTITAVTAPQHGTVEIVEGGTRVRYTPTAGYTGFDYFGYTTTNALGQTVSQGVSLTVASGRNFYQPSALAPATLNQFGFYDLWNGGTAFDLRDNAYWRVLPGKLPPTRSFSYEIEVKEADIGSAWVGVGNWNWLQHEVGAPANEDRATASLWLLGTNQASTGAVFADGYRRAEPGDILGVSYSEVSRTTRIYLNGELVVTIPTPQGADQTQRLPIIPTLR